MPSKRVFHRAGGTARLPRVVGKSIAKELIFTGGKVSGKDAMSIGMITKRTFWPEFCVLSRRRK